VTPNFANDPDSFNVHKFTDAVAESSAPCPEFLTPPKGCGHRSDHLVDETMPDSSSLMMRFRSPSSVVKRWRRGRTAVVGQADVRRYL